MIGKTVYVVNLYPYYGVEVFANYNDAEAWLAEAAAKESAIYFDKEEFCYKDNKDRHFSVIIRTII